MIEDKGYNVTFDSNLTSPNGNNVNALINTNQNGEVDIRLNPNSPRAGEFLLVHEITHAIETDSMKQLVMDYASKNSEFNNALESLKQTYGTNDVSSEVLADISGQLLGNEEFINNLSMKEPSVFKKIYDKIIEIANKITGKTESNETKFINDLKNKWETAYRTQNNNLNDTEYSIGILSNGEPVVISDDLMGSNPSKEIVTQNLKKMLGNKYNNSTNNSILEIENKDIKKYLNDGYHNNKNMKLKKRISGNYGEILEISKIDSTKENYKGTNRGKSGFDYYKVNLAYPVKTSDGSIQNYRYYDARLVVRKEANGQFAYDLDNFKEKKEPS